MFCSAVTRQIGGVIIFKALCKHFFPFLPVLPPQSSNYSLLSEYWWAWSCTLELGQDVLSKIQHGQSEAKTKWFLSLDAEGLLLLLPFPQQTWKWEKLKINPGTTAANSVISMC